VAFQIFEQVFVNSNSLARHRFVDVDILIINHNYGVKVLVVESLQSARIRLKLDSLLFSLPVLSFKCRVAAVIGPERVPVNDNKPLALQTLLLRDNLHVLKLPHVPNNDCVGRINGKDKWLLWQSLHRNQRMVVPL
jgi:hypothetical protein